MLKSCVQGIHRLLLSLFPYMDAKHSAQFQRRYAAITVRRGRLFIWVTFFIGIYSLYADLLLKREHTIDLVYRQNLTILHLVMLALSVLYILAYGLLARAQRPGLAKVIILTHMFFTLLIAAVMAVNSQRFTGSIEVYILAAFSVAVVVPIYPKWVMGIYLVIHGAFLLALSFFFQNNSILMKQFNSTAIIVVALILFVMLYRYNVKTFVNEHRLKEDKATFIKLFETNPFPLIISRFADGKVTYANHKAMSFYEIRESEQGSLSHQHFFKNASDWDVLKKMLELGEKVNDHMVELRTTTGKVKCPVVNCELIDYFGEKSILCGVADIAEIKRIEQELAIYASTDMLTGVINRRVGMDLVTKRYETVEREGGRFTLCFIDIDNLKAVNDQYGHLEGDALINEVCSIIGQEINPQDMLFRYGGDEFVVLFAQEDEQSIGQICQRISTRYGELNDRQYKPYSISASMGTFTYQPQMKLSLEQIIQAVDKNMYTNKLEKNGAEIPSLSLKS